MIVVGVEGTGSKTKSEIQKKRVNYRKTDTQTYNQRDRQTDNGLEQNEEKRIP